MTQLSLTDIRKTVLGRIEHKKFSFNFDLFLGHPSVNTNTLLDIGIWSSEKKTRLEMYIGKSSAYKWYLKLRD